MDEAKTNIEEEIIEEVLTAEPEEIAEEETQSEPEAVVEEAREEEVEVQEEAAAENEEDEEPVGNIKISVDVVATIAGIAASEIDGVAYMYSSFAGGIAERLGAKKNPSKGVKVEMDESSVTVDLYIVVDYGVRIPELAWEVQENVKNNIETMTGLDVEKVNIHIEGVSFEKEKAEALEAAKSEEAEVLLPEGDTVEE